MLPGVPVTGSALLYFESQNLGKKTGSGCRFRPLRLAHNSIHLYKAAADHFARSVEVGILVRILKKNYLCVSAAAALLVAVALAGCGTTNYFGNRTVPPSKLQNRVMIAIQNPSALSKGALQIVDAFYDERSGYNGTPASFSISGYGGALPISIQNMPEEQLGAVYGSGDGSFALISYGGEKESGTVSGLPGLSSSIFLTRSQQYVFAASHASNVFTVINQATGQSASLGLPGVYRVSVNTGGTVALGFVQNSNYIYYPRQLTTAQSLSYSGGVTTWPKAAVDCEPQNAPTWCLFQAQSPDAVDATGNYYGAPLTFDRPIKALFSADGSTAYILNCGPECGGTTASISILPIAPMIFQLGQSSGRLPTTGAVQTLAIPGGSTNALIDSSTMYVVGQCPELPSSFGTCQPAASSQTYFGGNLTVVNLATFKISNPAVSISDGTAGGVSRMIEGDNNTLWIGMTQCTNGIRYATSAPGGYGCLTMYNTSTNQVEMVEPYLGDATGIAAVTGLNKIYTAEGGQVYIYSTTNGSAIDNQYVTVTGTAWDVAYMDAASDSNNTVY